MGALSCNSDDAYVTTLGRLAKQFPLDVRLSRCVSLVVGIARRFSIKFGPPSPLFSRLLFYSIALGVPVDGVILAASISSQELFTSPSSFFYSDPADYSRALQRSLRFRAAFDAGQYSEPLMHR